MMNPFPGWQSEVENDAVVIDASQAGLEIEAMNNLWTFALTQQQAQELKQEEVIHFLDAVLSARERQIKERFGYQHQMVFYCWFDEQAAQLRFSLVSASHNRLPFKIAIHFAADLSLVAKQFLSSPYHGGISLEDFESQVSVAPRSVTLWAKQIPSNLGSIS